jgi:hypothetical protein
MEQRISVTGLCLSNSRQCIRVDRLVHLIQSTKRVSASISSLRFVVFCLRPFCCVFKLREGCLGVAPVLCLQLQ